MHLHGKAKSPAFSREVRVSHMKRINFALLVFIIAGCGETIKSEGHDFESAKILMDTGWLPKWLPESSTDIRESHNLDTNTVVASFNPNIDGVWHPQECDRIGPFEPPQPDLKVAWWPSDVPGSQLSTYRHTFYRCKGNSYLAVTPDGTEAHYWSNMR